MKKRVLVLAAAMACSIGMAGSTLRAENIAAAEAAGSGTVTIDSGPVVTAILSQPGTVNGKSYSNYSFLANDGSGSLMVYLSSANATTVGYTPTVGDSITVTGTYSPYHQIPELGSSTAGSISAITPNSTGNAVPSIGLATIAQLNVATQPFTNVAYLWQLDNVTISGAGSGNWGVANSPTGAAISDGANSMTLYYWPTSYSLANANMANSPIPTGPVNMIGFVSDYNNVAEFSPISVTPVPEPASVALLGMGALFLAGRRRKVSSPSYARSHRDMMTSRNHKGLCSY